MGGACSARMGEIKNAYNTSMVQPEGKRPLGRHKHRLGHT
jgi:hypothetical protein